MRRGTSALQAGLTGTIVLPGDPGYDDLRRIHNGLIDKRPSLIARCAAPADVAATVLYAREHGMELAVRGGGHNVAGRAVTEGGVMIDFGLMKTVDVDPHRRIATAGPGTTWAEFDAAAGKHDLATTGGVVSSTGIAGLTLGGGLGHLMGRHGLTVDNLIRAQVVTAEGLIVTADDDEHPDLFWALRGGGGNFGVVTSFEYALHEVPDVLGGAIVHPFSAAGAVLAGYRRVTQSPDDDLSLSCGLLHGPDGAKVVALPICHSGSAEAATRAVDRVAEIGSPQDVSVERMPYPKVNTLLDGAFPRGALNYWKSAMMGDLSEAAIDALVNAFSGCPSPMTLIVLERIHGAATRVEPTATAFPHRHAGYSVLILSQWADAVDTHANVAWTRDTFEALQPFLSADRYVNYMASDDAGHVRDAFGPNWEKLVDVKRRYDPDNVFRLNQNIDPRLWNNAQPERHDPRDVRDLR